MRKNTTRKVVKESILDKVSMGEFTKMYGADVAKALEKYCDAMHKEPEEVLNGDDMEMTRFENWAKRKLKMDIYKNFGDYDYAKDLDKDAKSRMVDESGSMDEQDIIDWIGNELSECEWCSDITFDDSDATVEVETDEGMKFEISVKPISSINEDSNRGIIESILNKFVAKNNDCKDVTYVGDDDVEYGGAELGGEYYFIDVVEDLDQDTADEIVSQLEAIPELKNYDVHVERYNDWTINGIIVEPN